MLKSTGLFKGMSIARDVQGLSRLTVEAIHGITDLVESLHLAITGLAALRGAPKQQQTSGVTGLVYRNIRSVTQWVGQGIDPLLDRLAAVMDQQESSPTREALLSALNGVLGDHLAARNNPLAIPMQFRCNAKPIHPQAIPDLLPPDKTRLLVMVHGLCMNDLQWRRREHDHGAAIARDLNLTRIYLHYNSGLHVSENGKSFAYLLEQTLNTLQAQAAPPLELFILAHSMGGLVSRSACHYGTAAKHECPKHLKKIVFLGTPHQGSHWEKGGNLVDVILETNPYSAPFSRLGKTRSSGITDLRYGNVADEDWQNRDRFEASGNHRTPVPLPQNTACYAIAGMRQVKSENPMDNLIGDGLVSVDSALGRHPNPQLELAFPKTHQWVGHGVNHSDLLNSPEVYSTLVNWLKPEE